MSRIRSIHPGLFTDEAFMSASIAARILIIGIWTEAWDDGVFEWKPLTLKAKIFPVDNVDAGSLLLELEGLSFVRKFDVNGKLYGAIRNFRKYQKPKTPNSSGVLPPDLVSFVAMPSELLPNHFGNASEKPALMEDGGGKRKEEKKEVEARPAVAAPEKPLASKKGTRLDPAWIPLPEDHSMAVALLGRQRADSEVAKFRDYWPARPGKDGCKLDWHATFRNWIRRASESPAPRFGSTQTVVGIKPHVRESLVWVEEGSDGWAAWKRSKPGYVHSQLQERSENGKTLVGAYLPSARPEMQTAAA